MNKILLLGFSALLFYAVAEGLMCKVCKYRLGSFCFSSHDPCRADEGQYCETTKVYAGDFLMFSRYSCGLYAELCNKTEQRDNPFRTSYHRSCCNSDLCNG
ncbi:PREDICTED: lymphocyte antigen 6 complex locus protein G6c-like [Gekko japonicus]|uniref:Lymphocyte antigen 6 complex locus protein G6c-like n=1 Tax=Gekko japonicus TaxID=146911 RepID=A0ABM1KQS8_GEKJA|nr:PREDICTED: lymphocyte antigen 6 complex locus protein G6c-like [Gekko japonicus]